MYYRTFKIVAIFFIIYQVTIFFHYLWVAPVMIIIVTILSWQKIGVYVLPGLLIFLLLGPLQALIGRFFAKLRYSGQQCKYNLYYLKNIDILVEDLFLCTYSNQFYILLILWLYYQRFLVDTCILLPTNIYTRAIQDQLQKYIYQYYRKFSFHCGRANNYII